MAQIRGRDLSAPVQTITLGGRQYSAVYNNRCARICEDVYEQHYGKDLGYGQILGQLAKGKYAAIMAILYGAIVAGGCEMSFEAFDALFSLESIEGMRDLIIQAVEQSLPDAGEQARENPQQVPGTGV